MFFWELSSLFCLGAVLATAVVTDLRTRRIPNVLVLFGIALGFFFQIVTPEGNGLFARYWGAIGPLQGLYGLLAGLGLLLPLYALRAMGAGDVKLLGMLGVWFGPGPMVGVFVFTLLAGGMLALGVALWNGALRQAIGNIRYMVTDTVVRVTAGGSGQLTQPVRTSGRLPYALALAVGAALEVALLKGWWRSWLHWAI
jgi:prepilin peptidase CpaA